MVLHLSRKQQKQLLNWTKDAGNRECCGILLGGAGVVSDMVIAANVADDPTQHFEIDPAALIAAEKHARQGGPPIIGYFHSHPNGLKRPSQRDAASAADNGRIWLIVADGEISAWFPNVNDMTGVQFVPVEIIVET